MQRESEPSQVAVGGNILLNFMFSINSFQIKKLMKRAKQFGSELKELIIFIVLSMLLLTGISLLPNSPVMY